MASTAAGFEPTREFPSGFLVSIINEQIHSSVLTSYSNFASIIKNPRVLYTPNEQWETTFVLFPLRLHLQSYSEHGIESDFYLFRSFYYALGRSSIQLFKCRVRK